MGKFTEKYRELSDKRILRLYENFGGLEPEAKQDLEAEIELRNLQIKKTGAKTKVVNQQERTKKFPTVLVLLTLVFLYWIYFMITNYDRYIS